MASVNTRNTYTEKTHGGSPAARCNAAQQLRRIIMSTLLWEDQFYIDGKSLADSINEASQKVSKEVLSQIAIEARQVHNLRHVPLLLCVELAKKGGSIVSDTLYQVIQRADELTEFMAMYWQNGKCPISKQVKKGLARAFTKFDAYQLAKYDRERAIRLRDVLFMVHAKPKNEKQAADWKALVDGTLPTPDTWETNLSGGSDKKETWERMLSEGKLGYLALLRNLRNMTDVGVDRKLIKDALVARKGGADKVLPFRYVAAARACPSLETDIDKALCAAISEQPQLKGSTVVLVDVSGSMDAKLSGKSDLARMDAAASLAALINAEDLRVFSFSSYLCECPNRRGIAGVDCVIKSQGHCSTELAGALKWVNANIKYDRLIVITDEQNTDGRIPSPKCDKAYMINVASYKNGIGYQKWTHLDGFSEGVIKFIHALESEPV